MTAFLCKQLCGNRVNIRRSEEERNARREWYRTLPIDQKQRIRERSIAWYHGLSEEERQRVNDRSQIYFKNLPKEKKLEYSERRKQKYREKNKAKIEERKKKLRRRLEMLPKTLRMRHKEDKQLEKLFIRQDHILHRPEIEQLLRLYHFIGRVKPKQKKEKCPQLTKTERELHKRLKSIRKQNQKRLDKLNQAKEVISQISKILYSDNEILVSTLKIFSIYIENSNCHEELLCVVAASFYLACRQEGVLCPLIDISSAIQVEMKRINRTVRLIQQKHSIPFGPISVRKLVAKYCKEMKLPQDVEELAKELTNKLLCFVYSREWNPQMITAIAIFMATITYDIYVDASEISTVTKIPALSIEEKYRELSPYLNELLMDAIKQEPIEL
uniref:Cyclin-like domain-containing protein n=1 Tax=Acrobeloides nanus TaxID=290746 RepID=A0A914CS39_9BILA